MFNVPQEKIDKGIYWSHGCTAIEGCTPVSAGCDNCWAAAMAHQYKRDFSQVSFHLDRLEEKSRGKKPKVISVWNDVFHEATFADAPVLRGFSHENMIDIIDEHPQHQYLLLTKRPDNIAMVVQSYAFHRGGYLPPNLWLGTTAENQECAGRRIPELLKCGSPNLFLSLEPLLGRVEWIPVSSLRWVIVGCETGPKRRPCDPGWIHSIVRQCKQGGVPCFVKAVNIGGRVLKRWDELEFPDDLKAREFPIYTASEVVEVADG